MQDGSIRVSSSIYILTLFIIHSDKYHLLLKMKIQDQKSQILIPLRALSITLQLLKPEVQVITRSTAKLSFKVTKAKGVSLDDNSSLTKGNGGLVLGSGPFKLSRWLTRLLKALSHVMTRNFELEGLIC